MPYKFALMITTLETTRHLSTRGKRYGRRSRPDSEADTSYSDNDFDSYSDSKRSTSPAPVC